MATKKAADDQAKGSTDETPEVPPAVDPQATNPTDPKVDIPVEPPAQGKSVDDIAGEVLAGNWGDSLACRGRLDGAGYDSKAVMVRVNERLSKGAPGAYRPSPIGLLKQVQDGEWGDEKGIVPRLAGAGFSAAVVAEVVRNLHKD